MKIRSLITIFSFVLFSLASQASGLVLDIVAADIDRLRLHTSLISPNTLQNVLTIKTTKMTQTDGSCSGGGYIPLENNTATYSAILASYLAGKEFSIMYDTELTLAGSSAYCAILYFDVIK